MKTLCFTLAVSLLASSSSFAAPAFPGQDWDVAAPESLGIDPLKLAAFSNYVFTDKDGRQSDSLVVIYKGKLVYEKYAYDYTKDMRHLSWSMAKSFTTAVMGIAEHDGIISRHSKVAEFYPQPVTDPAQQALREEGELQDLLTMSSGIQWVEDYTPKTALKSDVAQMLYMNPSKDRAAYVASRPMLTHARNTFYYSTGMTMLAMGMLKQQMTTEAYNRYPKEKLFDKIGMKNVVWEQDEAGTFDGGSYLYATPRDYARFGYLLLNKGNWNGDQVIPTEWVQEINTLAPGFAGSIKPSKDTSYGTGFWLNKPVPKWNMPVPYPNAPSDTFVAIGHLGQSIAILPSQDLVIVRTAHDSKDGANDLNVYLGMMLDAIGTRAPVPATTTEPTYVGPVIHAARANVPPAAALVKHTGYLNFPKLVAGSRARDFCSCHFIVGQTDELCSAIVKNGLPVIHSSVNNEKKTVTYGILPAVTAHVVSEEMGCSF